MNILKFIKDKKLPTWLPEFLVLGLIVVAASWALFWPTFFRVHDYTHAARISQLTTAVGQGQFPVRWVSDFGFGYGMPLYSFYAPLPYYVGGLFFWLNGNVVLSIKALYLLSNLITAVGSFLLAKTLFGKKAGLIAAALITLAPYRAVNLYVRGALSEAWGLMAVPLILYSSILIIKKQNTKSASLLLLISIAVLLLSHNLTALMALPMAVFFTAIVLLMQWWLQKLPLLTFLKKLGWFVWSYFAGVGLSMFYVLPAVLENQATSISSILSGYFAYWQHFLYIRQFFNPTWGYGSSTWGPEDGISFFLGFGQILGILIFGCSLACWLWRVFRKNWQTTAQDKFALTVMGASLLITLISIFLTLLKSEPIWNSIPILSYVQFPWRWLSVTIVGWGVLVAGLGYFIPKAHSKIYTILTVCVIGASLVNGRFFQPENWLTDDLHFYYTSPSLIQSNMSEILPDFIPSKLAVDGFLDREALLKTREITDFESEWQSVGVAVKPISEAMHYQLYQVNTANPVKISWPKAAFPGWDYQLNGKTVDSLTLAEYLDQTQVETNPLTVDGRGLLLTSIPAGDHTIGIVYGKTSLQKLSEIISLISLFIVLIVFIPLKRNNPNAKN